jgi:hypothetical protein
VAMGPVLGSADGVGSVMSLMIVSVSRCHR